MADIIHNLSVGGTSRPLGTVHYIEGTGTAAGTWLGSDPSITAYYDGLTIAYKVNIAGGSSTTTLNINGLGAKTVRRNASNLTTHYPVNSVVHLTYTTISGTSYWQCADYDANTDTKNTAGSSDTSSKIFLVGATSQTSSATTYSHDTAYVGTDGHLYSNSSKVFSTSYAPEGYLQWGGQNVSGGVTPIGMSLSEEHSGNKAAFINGDAITIEYSTDGTTFTDAGINKWDKTALFTTSYSVPIGGNTAMTSSNYTKLKTRITLTAQDGASGYYLYTDVKKLLVNMSTAASTTMLIETMQGNSTSWVTYGTYDVSGWSGWNDIPLMITLGGSSSQKDRPWKVRFTFSLTSCNASYSTTKHVSGFRIFGQNSWNVISNLARTGHLYSYDIYQNATFPAGLNTTGELKENGTRVSKVGHTHTIATESKTSGGPSATVNVASTTHTHTVSSSGSYTPAGSVSQPTFTGSAVTSGGASSTTSIYQITGVGSVPSLSAAIANNCMTFTWSAGSVPTRSAVTVATAHTHSVTAAGTVSKPTFSGTAATISVSGTTAASSGATTVPSSAHTHTTTVPKTTTAASTN